MKAVEIRRAPVDIICSKAGFKIEDIDGVYFANIGIVLALFKVFCKGTTYGIKHAQKVIELVINLHFHQKKI